MPQAYCTLEDVRRALRKASLPGDIGQDKQIAVDAITAQSKWLERTYKRHWYAPTGASILDEAYTVDIPTEPLSRDDELDIPTHGAFVHGASEYDRYRYRENSDALLEADPRHEHRREHDREPKAEIRIATGEYYDHHHTGDGPAYTRLRLDRKDVAAVDALYVINSEGAYDDWVASDDYDGGVGLQHRGADYWGRVNNSGVSELYLDVRALDDRLTSLSNAVYLEWAYGHEGIPANIRRAVANFAGAEFAEEASVQIPDNATVYNIETKAEQMREKAEKLLDPDAVGL